MLDKEVKKRLINKIKANVSINKISKELILGKSTIYYHYKKIRGRKYKKLNLNPGYSEKEGEIVGIFAGDGSQHFEKESYSYAVMVYFGNKNRNYALYVKKLFDSYFGKDFTLMKSNEHSIKIYTKSKEIYNHFHKYLNFTPSIKHCTVRLKTLNLPEEFLVGFIRGFLDTDGWISKAKDRTEPRIGFSTTSKSLAWQIKELLNRFEIKCGLYTIDRSHLSEKTMYNIQIWKESTDKFLNKVKPFKLRTFGPVV